MSTPLSRLALRVAYGARQLPRMAWYVGHSLALRRLAEETRRREGRPPRAVQTDRPVPERASLYADMAELLRADLENVERGIYPLPADRDGPPLAMLRRSLAFFQDLPQVHRRREADARSGLLPSSQGLLFRAAARPLPCTRRHLRHGSKAP